MVFEFLFLIFDIVVDDLFSITRCTFCIIFLEYVGCVFVIGVWGGFCVVRLNCFSDWVIFVGCIGVGEWIGEILGVAWGGDASFGVVKLFVVFRVAAAVIGVCFWGFIVVNVFCGCKRFFLCCIVWDFFGKIVWLFIKICGFFESDFVDGDCVNIISIWFGFCVKCFWFVFVDIVFVWLDLGCLCNFFLGLDLLLFLVLCFLFLGCL